MIKTHVWRAPYMSEFILSHWRQKPDFKDMSGKKKKNPENVKNSCLWSFMASEKCWPSWLDCFLHLGLFSPQNLHQLGLEASPPTSPLSWLHPVLVTVVLQLGQQMAANTFGWLPHTALLLCSKLTRRFSMKFCLSTVNVAPMIMFSEDLKIGNINQTNLCSPTARRNCCIN